MVRKQVLPALKHSRRESLLEKLKSEPDIKKLTFNITLLSGFSKCEKHCTSIAYSANTKAGT